MTEQNNTAPMTTEVAQMHRDIAAGTPGPWLDRPKGKHPNPYVCGAEQEYEAGIDRPVVCYLVGMDTATNARRIARLPDLEAAYLTLVTQLAERDAECREAVMQSLTSMGQAQEAHEAQVQAEAEMARVTAELDTAQAGWDDQKERHKECFQASYKTLIRSLDAEHALIATNARIAALTEALTFYADEATYETQYELMPCDCCTNIFEPINDDKGAVARAALTTDKEPT